MSLDGAMAQLLATFFEESFEGLDRAETRLLSLLEDGSQEAIGDLFRAIHSIKGGAGAFGVDEVTALAHVMENLLSDVRDGAVPTRDMTDALLRGVDQLRRSLEARRANRSVDPRDHAPLIEELVALRAAATATPASTQAPAPVEAHDPWLVRFAPHPGMMRSGNDAIPMLRQLAALGAELAPPDLSKLPPLEEMDPTAAYLSWVAHLPGSVAHADISDVFAWVDGDCDLSIARATPAPVALAPLAPTTPTPAVPSEARSDVHSAAAGSATLRVGVDKIDLLMNMVGELVITQSMLGELEDDRPLDTERISRIREGLSLLARTTRALQESVVRLRSMPVGVVFARLPRLVHDLVQRLEKDVAITITGQTTELDRTVIEKIGDPLVHIVRNSIDHGIEAPDVRVAAGKPRQGSLRVHAEHRGSAVVIEVSDDGAGLDLARILAKAKERGLVPPDAQPPDHEIVQLIFAPGFSTAKQVSEVSGRGVGMDVVWRQIKELRGDVTVTSVPGKGLKTVLSLPLTLAIVDGQLIRLGEQTYAIPLLSIVETIELRPEARRRIGGRDVVRLRDQIVPIVDLAQVLGVRPDGSDPSGLLMIVEAEGAPLGLLVDELLAQQQIVIKSLETNFGRVDGLAGATILGDGRVAFILDIVALYRDVRRSARPAERGAIDLAA